MNVRISQLPTAPSAITGAELVPIVQNGETVQATVNQLVSSPAQTQTFLTVNHEPTLPNSRYFGVGVGIGITDTGAQGKFSLFLNATSGSLEVAGYGLIAKTGAGTVAARAIQISGAGFSVTNGDGISGNPTLAATGLLYSLANLGGTGLIFSNGSTLSPLSIAGTTNQINVASGNGVSGNPTISFANDAIFPGTAGITVPNGTTGQRPIAPNLGQMRYNTTTSRFEFYEGGMWAVIGIGDGTVTQVNGTANQINVINNTTTPTVSIVNNPTLPGSGGVLIPIGTTAQRPGSGNGTLRYNSDTGTFEGYANGIWGAIVTGSGVTSVATGTGLTGGPITSTGTISIANTTVTAGSYGSDSSVGTFIVNGQGQLTTAASVAISIAPSQINATIPNSGLTNSSVTVGSTNIALGATSLTLSGLTSVTVTQDPTAALQLATKQYVDNIAQGLNTKAPVLCATTANITLSGEQTIDGITTSASRVLVKNQSAAANNGIYLSGSGAWTRTTDANTWNQLVSAYVFVEQGAINADTGWVCTSDPGGTLGVTAVTWVQFSGAGTYTAGTGLTLTGTQFSITNTAVTAGTYGNAARNMTLVVNAQGQLTNIFDQPISIAPSQINATIPNSGLTNSSITINGSAISLGGSVSVGTVTSVAALTLGTTGTDLSSSVATGTTTPVITLNVPTASATNRGALSAADWTTFNGKANSFTYTANYIPYGQGTTTPLQSANHTFDGTVLTLGNAGVSARFQGDFSNATFASRTAFVTGTTNGATGIYALPNGTSTAASWQAFNNSNPTNASKILIATNGSTDVQLVSGINGTGTYLPMTFWNNGAEKARLSVAGGFSIGTATDAGATNLLVAGTATALNGVGGGNF